VKIGNSWTRSGQHGPKQRANSEDKYVDDQVSDAYGVAPGFGAEILCGYSFTIFFALQSPVILLCHGAMIRKSSERAETHLTSLRSDSRGCYRHEVLHHWTVLPSDGESRPAPPSDPRQDAKATLRTPSLSPLLLVETPTDHDQGFRRHDVASGGIRGKASNAGDSTAIGAEERVRHDQRHDLSCL
jgi:hypothetical protein